MALTEDHGFVCGSLIGVDHVMDCTSISYGSLKSLVNFMIDLLFVSSDIFLHLQLMLP